MSAKPCIVCHTNRIHNEMKYYTEEAPTLLATSAASSVSSKLSENRSLPTNPVLPNLVPDHLIVKSPLGISEIRSRKTRRQS